LGESGLPGADFLRVMMDEGVKRMDIVRVRQHLGITAAVPSTATPAVRPAVDAEAHAPSSPVTVAPAQSDAAVVPSTAPPRLYVGDVVDYNTGVPVAQFLALTEETRDPAQSATAWAVILHLLRTQGLDLVAVRRQLAAVGALHAAVATLTSDGVDEKRVDACVSVVAAIALDNWQREAVATAGALPAIVSVMERVDLSATVAVHAISAMLLVVNDVDNPVTKAAVVAAGVVEATIAAVMQYPDDDLVTKMACGLIGDYVLKATLTQGVALDAMRVVVTAMQRFGDDSLVQSYGCRALGRGGDRPRRRRHRRHDVWWHRGCRACDAVRHEHDTGIGRGP
jgi:hypothetical protein